MDHARSDLIPSAGCATVITAVLAVVCALLNLFSRNDLRELHPTIA
ncbi:MAG: hypothetical protein ACLFP4_08975 [Spirochaetales bacterium]